MIYSQLILSEKEKIKLIGLGRYFNKCTVPTIQAPQRTSSSPYPLLLGSHWLRLRHRQLSNGERIHQMGYALTPLSVWELLVFQWVLTSQRWLAVSGGGNIQQHTGIGGERDTGANINGDIHKYGSGGLQIGCKEWYRQIETLWMTGMKLSHHCRLFHFLVIE